MTANDLSGLKNALITYLRADMEFSGIRITPEYPSAREYPMKKPVIAIGIDSAELRGSLGSYMGMDDSGGIYGSECLITMRFDILAPEGGYDPCVLMEKLCDALMISRNDFGFLKLWSDACSWDKTAGGLKLSVKGSLITTMTHHDGEAAITGVIVAANPTV